MYICYDKSTVVKFVVHQCLSLYQQNKFYHITFIFHNSITSKERKLGLS